MKKLHMRGTTAFWPLVLSALLLVPLGAAADGLGKPTDENLAVAQAIQEPGSIDGAGLGAETGATILGGIDASTGSAASCGLDGSIGSDEGARPLSEAGEASLSVSMTSPRLGQVSGVDYYAEGPLGAEVVLMGEEASGMVLFANGEAVSGFSWDRDGKEARVFIDCSGISGLALEARGADGVLLSSLRYGEQGTYDSEGDEVDGTSFGFAPAFLPARVLVDGAAVQSGETVFSPSDSCEVRIEVPDSPLYSGTAISVNNKSDEGWAESEERADGNAIHAFTKRFGGEGRYAFDVRVAMPWDSGAELSSCSAVLCVDRTAPRVEVGFDGDVPSGEVDGLPCFNRGRTATVKVHETSFAADLVDMKAPGGCIGTWEEREPGVHEARIEFPDDGVCRLQVTASDPAGNASSPYDSGEFAMDLTPPRLHVDFEGPQEAGYVDGTAFFNGGRVATIAIEEENYDPDLVRIETNGNVSWDEDSTKSARVVFERDDTYYLRISVQDMAGNVADPYDSGTFVVDTRPPRISVVFSGAEQAGEQDGTGFFAGSRQASISVEDEHLDPAGVQIVTSGSVERRDEASGTATVRFSEEGNHSLVVTASDRAGNAANPYESAPFIVDTSEPEVSMRVSRPLSGTDGDTDYFNDAVTLSIEVRDENFDPASRVDSQGASSESSWERVDGFWAKRLVYTEGARSTPEVFARDLAGNAAHARYGQATYDGAGRPLTGRALVVDATPPDIDISFDGAEPRNEKYFNAARTATVTVRDASFDPSLINVEATGSIGPWVASSGDAHVVEVEFAQEGTHTLSVSGKDKAGNEAEPRSIDEFVVDLSAPQVELLGASEGAAYADEVDLQAAVLDEVGIDPSSVQVSLTGAKRGQVEVPLPTEADACSVSWDLGGFERVPEADDVYTACVTACDLAGNDAQGTVTFSVNRFGSTFRILNADELERNGGYLAQAPEVVMQEINVSGLPLGGQGISLSCGANVEELGEKSDGGTKGFEVQELPGEAPGGWGSYLYIVGPENFSADGRYIVAAYSRDRANNLNSSTGFFDRESGTEKSAQAEFVLDTTAPTIDDIDVAPGQTIVSDGYECAFTVGEDIGLLRVDAWLDGEPVELREGTSGSYSLLIGPRENEPRELRVEAVDLAGNERFESVRGFYVTADPGEATARSVRTAFWALCGIAFATLAVCWAARALKSRAQKE